MAKYRAVHCSFWTDPKVLEEFTLEDKFFFLYLLTNEHTSQIGVYKITKKQIAFEMGYSLEPVNSLITRFENVYKLIKYNAETRELAIKHWGKYNNAKGGKPIIDCINKELSDIKDLSLIIYVAQCIKNEKIKEVVINYINGKIEENKDDEETNDTLTTRSTIRGQKEKEKEKEEEKINKKNNNYNDYDETELENVSLHIKIIDYFNLVTKMEYRYNNPEIIKLIQERISEGFGFAHFKKVIDIKNQEWKGTEYEAYIRPRTLFGDKFEDYVNQKFEALNNNKNLDSFSKRKQRIYDMDKIEKELFGYNQ